jgi:choline dehydrogenase
MLREGIKLVRMLGQTPPLNNSFGPEISPGPAVTTDDQIQSWLINGASTQYHPIGTCAMLPKSQSGVVNAQLQVYGTSTSNFIAHLLAIPARLIFFGNVAANVRVVDSSVFPFEFGGHVRYYLARGSNLCAHISWKVGGSTYGLAEQASDIIIRTNAASTLTNSFLDFGWLSIYFSILLAGHLVL